MSSMPGRLLVLLVACGFAHHAWSQNPPPAAAEAVAAQARGTPARGFLWEARQGDRRVYLLGTIHVGKPGFHPSGADDLARLEQAEVIAVEADVSEASRVGPIVQKWANYPAGAAGLDERAPALRSRIEALALRSAMSADVLWRMKPWMVANAMVVVEAARLGFSPAQATEAFLFDFARRRGKPLVEIEGIEAQLRLFDTAPESTQIAYLRQTIESIERGDTQDEITQLVTAWEKGDAGAMERLLAKMHGATGVAERFIVERIIDGRHPRMVDAIERYAASGKLHLVAIGSLHFFGPNGLIELLRKRGYAVVPMP